MPYTIKTKDGILVMDIPDDMPQDDPKLKALVAQLRASGQKSASFNDIAAPAAPASAAPTAAPALTPEEMAALTSEQAMMAGQGPKVDVPGMMGAVVRGAGPVAAGTLAGAAAGSVIPGVGTVAGGAAGGGAMAAAQLVGDPLVDLVNNLFGTQITRPTDALMQLFTSLGVPEPDTWAERIVQAGATGGAGAAGTALLGQALSQGAKQLSPSVAKAVGDALAAGAGQQIAGGVGSGLAGQAAAEAGASPLVQMGASVAGGMAGSALGGMRPGPSRLAQAPLEEAAGAGVRVLPGDVNPPKTGFARWVSRRVDELPFGPGGLRAKQAQERVKAVQDLIRQYGADDLAAASSEVMDDLRATHGAALQKWSTAKTEVIDRLSQSVGVSASGSFDDLMTKSPKPSSRVLQAIDSWNDPDGNATIQSSLAKGVPDQNARELVRYTEGSSLPMDMSLHRGLELPKVPSVGDTLDVRTLGAFSADPKIARRFATEGMGEGIPVVLEWNAPAGSKAAVAPVIGSAGTLVDNGTKEVLAAPGKWKVTGTRMADGVAIVTVAQEGAAAPRAIVPMTNTIAKIDESIAMLKSMKTKQVEPVIKILDDWKQAIQGQDLANIELLRKQIGDVFTAPDLASVRSTSEKVLSGIYGAVNEDMGAFIKAAGDPSDFTKWKVANTELAKMMKELERPALKVAIEKGAETPEYISNLLFSRKRSDVEALYRGLSPTGKAAARAAVIARAAGDAGETVSPDKFATLIKKMGDQVGVLFEGEDLKQVNGLVRVLDFTKKAASANAMPNTGVQAVLPLGAAAVAAGLERSLGTGLEGAIVVGAGISSAGALASAYNSAYAAAVRNPEVRKILVQLPALKPGGPEELAMLKRLVSAMQVAQQAPSKHEKTKTTERTGTLYAK